VLWATDFFTTEVWKTTGLTTFYALFFLQLQTRRDILGGLTPFPKDAWLKQVARNLTAADGPNPSPGYHFLRMHFLALRVANRMGKHLFEFSAQLWRQFDAVVTPGICLVAANSAGPCRGRLGGLERAWI